MLFQHLKFLFYLKNYPNKLHFTWRMFRFEKEEIIFICILWGLRHSRGLTYGWGGFFCRVSVGLPSPTVSPLPPPPPDKSASLPFSNRVSAEALGASSWACINVCVSKLPQLSGHVESHGFAFHEKLKSCPDLMEGNRWDNLGELSYCWSGGW